MTDTGRMIAKYAIIGFIVSLLEAPLVVSVFGMLGVALGPLLAVAIGAAHYFSKSKYGAPWWQYVGIAVLFPAFQILMLSIIPPLPVLISGSSVPIGPTIGLILADVLTLLSIRLMVRGLKLSTGGRAFGAVVGLLSIAHVAGLLLGQLVVTDPHWSFMASLVVTLVTTFTIICGYIGFLVGEKRKCGPVARATQLASPLA